MRQASVMKGLLLAALLILSGVLAGAGGAGSTDVVCGAEITSDVTLTKSLKCSGDGLIVTADDVTINLNDHKITGASVGNGILVQANRATVKHGTVKSFEIGIAVARGVSGSLFRDVKVVDNQWGIQVEFFTSDTHISDSVVSDNAQDGILFFGFGSPASIERSTMADNGNNGLTMYENLKITVRDNVFRRNGNHGYYAESSAPTVVGNIAKENEGDGFHLFERDGTSFADSWFVADNVANRNGGLGISACIQEHSPCLPGMIDGGGNSAKNNGDSRECVNIQCARNRDDGGDD